MASVLMDQFRTVREAAEAGSLNWFMVPCSPAVAPLANMTQLGDLTALISGITDTTLEETYTDANKTRSITFATKTLTGNTGGVTYRYLAICTDANATPSLTSSLYAVFDEGADFELFEASSRDIIFNPAYFHQDAVPVEVGG